MPSIIGLRCWIPTLSALTGWLSGSSQVDYDTTESSAKSKKPAKHGRLRTVTISSDLIKGKTFEEAMAALMDAMPTSPSGSGEADELEPTSLSETASTDGDTVSPSHTKHESAEELSASKAAHNTSNEVKPGCQCCDWAFVTEYAAIKVLQAAKPLGLGSTAYFE